MTQSKKNSGTIRIIGGTHRRRTLSVPPIEGVRPTPDRVRETLFNWLGQNLEGWRVLDLFAGSGILSLEARSRGAAEVISIERHPIAMRYLRDASSRLELPLQLIEDDAFAASSRLAKKQPRHFDLLLLDPPFQEADHWIDRLLPIAESLVAPDGWLYLETPHALEPSPSWEPYRSAVAGQVCYHLWRHHRQG